MPKYNVDGIFFSNTKCTFHLCCFNRPAVINTCKGSSFHLIQAPLDLNEPWFHVHLPTARLCLLLLLPEQPGPLDAGHHARLRSIPHPEPSGECSPPTQGSLFITVLILNAYIPLMLRKENMKSSETQGRVGSTSKVVSTPSPSTSSI